MYEIVESVRRLTGPGTVSRVVPFSGRYCHPRAAADDAVTALQAAPALADGRPRTYTIRKIYLPACPNHSSTEPDCGMCRFAVDAWLQELRGAAGPRNTPSEFGPVFSSGQG